MKNSLLSLALATALAIGPTVGAAQANSDKQIEARKAMFQGIKTHMGAMVAVAKKQAPFGPEARNHAQGMLAFAQMAPRMFPKGSDFGDTGALEKVWTEPEEFQKALDLFLKAATDMSQADESSWAASVGALGKACKNCHDNFREKH